MPKVDAIIVSDDRRGDGTLDNPHRSIRQHHALDGRLLLEAYDAYQRVEFDPSTARSWDDSLVQDRSGWWYKTEDEDVNGPFPTRLRAEKELAHYVKWLSQPQKEFTEALSLLREILALNFSREHLPTNLFARMDRLVREVAERDRS